MNIEIKDTITLNDNNEYLVISKTDYNGKVYYYLIDEKNKENIKFCYEKSDNNSLIEIDNYDLIQELLPKLFKSLKDNPVLF